MRANKINHRSDCAARVNLSNMLRAVCVSSGDAFFAFAFSRVCVARESREEKLEKRAERKRGKERGDEIVAVEERNVFGKSCFRGQRNELRSKLLMFYVYARTSADDVDIADADFVINI